MTDAERELLVLLAKTIRGAVPVPEGWREVMAKLIAKVERSAE